MKNTEHCSRPGWKTYILDERLLAIRVMAFGLTTAILLATFLDDIRQTGTFQCAPDVTLVLPDQTLSPSWDAKYFFSITLAWGEFDLSTAKIIDVFWDLIVGTGGQLLLSLLAFSTMRRAIWTSVEKRPWHLPVLARLMLDPVSYMGLWSTLKDIYQEGSGILAGFAFVITSILAFSTVVSAMRGYRSGMVPSYAQGEGTTLPLSTGKLTQVYPLELVNASSYNEGSGCSLAIQPDYVCVSDAFPDCVVPPGGECYDAWKRCRSHRNPLAC